MARKVIDFKGLNTDTYPAKIEPGSAISCVNMVYDHGKLSVRAGFDEYTGATVSDNSSYTATYSNGNTWAFSKDNGIITPTRIYPTATTGTTKESLANVPGWWFFWADRVYHFDQTGGFYYNESSDTWYEAGLATPATGVGAEAAAETPQIPPAAGKSGWYAVYNTFYNSKTGEESQATAGSNYIYTDVDDGTGAISQVGAYPTLDQEADTHRIYCSLGATEVNNASTPQATNTLVAFLDDETTGAASFGLKSGDQSLRLRQRMENNGGLPPASNVGIFDGSRAIYFDIYASGTAVPGEFHFSLPRIPTMVPKEKPYATTYNGTFYPGPFIGRQQSNMEGKVTKASFIAGKIIVLTSTAVYTVQPQQDGRYRAVKTSYSLGCPAPKASVDTGNSLYFYGNGTVSRVTSEGITDIADNRFRELLANIPADTEDEVVMGYYRFKRKVWIAIPTAAGGSDILVWDEDMGELEAVYESAVFETDRITSIVELRVQNDDPKLLVSTASDVWAYPSAAYKDDTTEGYEASVRYVMGQERRSQDGNAKYVEVHVVDDETTGEALQCTAIASRSAADIPDESVTFAPIVKKIDSNIREIDWNFEYNNGRIFTIELKTDASDTALWSVGDIIMEVLDKDQR